MKSFKELRKIIEAAEVVDPLPEIAPPGTAVPTEVLEALVEENANHRGKQKIAKDGTVLNIPGKKGGLTAYNIKPRLSGGKLEFFTTDNEGAIKVMSVQELAKVLK